MKFILSTSSSNSDYNAECDFAVVAVDAEVARLILSRREIFMTAREKDSDLYEMYFWDARPEFFSCTGVEEWAEEHRVSLPEECAFAYVGEVSIDETAAQPTECDQMVVTAEGVRWTTIPKHSDIYVTTTAISFDDVRGIV